MTLPAIRFGARLKTAIQRRYPSLKPTSTQLKNISNGPGKVVQTLGVSMADYGADLLGTHNVLHLEPGSKPVEIFQTKRIGISQAQDTLWRWHL